MSQNHRGEGAGDSSGLRWVPGDACVPGFVVHPRVASRAVGQLPTLSGSLVTPHPITSGFWHLGGAPGMLHSAVLCPLSCLPHTGPSDIEAD